MKILKNLSPFKLNLKNKIQIFKKRHPISLRIINNTSTFQSQLLN